MSIRPSVELYDGHANLWVGCILVIYCNIGLIIRLLYDIGVMNLNTLDILGMKITGGHFGYENKFMDFLA